MRWKPSADNPPNASPTRRQMLASAAGLAAAPLLAGIPGGHARAAAPLLGPTSVHHHRFRLGAFELTTILDAGAMLDGPWPIVGQDQKPEQVAALMRANLLPEKKFRPGFTPMVLNTGKELVLFDTGNGADGFVPRPNGGWLAAQLATAGFSADQFDLMVISHCHPDHIGGLMEGGSPLFPNASYVVGQAEFDFWNHADRLAADPKGIEFQTAQIFATHLRPLAGKTRLVRPGDGVVAGVEAVEAFGHTPGHLAFHIQSEGQELLFWADCAHHQVASLARPGWHALFDMDKAQGAKTRLRIYDMASADRLLVAGYHMPFPSLGYAMRDGEG